MMKGRVKRLALGSEEGQHGEKNERGRPPPSPGGGHEGFECKEREFGLDAKGRTVSLGARMNVERSRKRMKKKETKERQASQRVKEWQKENGLGEGNRSDASVTIISRATPVHSHTYLRVRSIKYGHR